ncbi:MAG: 30S ribosomal protein S16 [Gammaproteobacteria bacterium]|nr:30S ribosomal protein S16 [Gammaproteobacteria bacterium]
MVTIRLSRGGSKRRPFYSILIADQRRSARGRFIERIGFFNPVATGKEELLRLDTERFEHWVSQGAQPTERVTQLYKKAKSQPAAEAAA